MFMIFIFVVMAFVLTGLVMGNKLSKGAAVSALVAVAVIGLGFAAAVVVPAGHVGVVDLFGKVTDQTLKPGLQFVNPFARVINLSTKTQEKLQKAKVPSKEGLVVNLEISILFNLDSENAARIYKTVGPNYVDVILTPQVRSVIRSVTAQYDAKSLYTEKREELSQKIREQVSSLVKPRGINIESTPLRDVSLPPKLAAAIEEKLKAEQESQRMEFILEKERREADRKKIEASGIAEFQKIVTAGISNNLLQWKGIEATEKLANSQNSKVVIIGSGKNGLPVILNNK